MRGRILGLLVLVAAIVVLLLPDRDVRVTTVPAHLEAFQTPTTSTTEVLDLDDLDLAPPPPTTTTTVLSTTTVPPVTIPPTTIPPTTTTEPEPETTTTTEEEPVTTTTEPEPETTTTEEPDPPPTSHAPTLHGGWESLRQCESGGNYATNTGNGYFGAYQFDQTTWNGVVSRMGRSDLVGVRPSSASAGDQDAAAAQLHSERGSQPWPSCGRYV